MTPRPKTLDAVIVLPGIMGSELVDAATGDILWGISDPRWYVSAWTTGESLRRLAVTDEERSGTVTRVRASRLLSTPAAVPVFHGVEPYNRLVAEVRRVAVHPDAVAAFPYDWRLSVAHNARLLAAFAERHLDAWRAHRNFSELRRDPGEARLSLVAHSMGGLIATRYAESLGSGSPVRTVITLGTPFYGAVKAAFILSTGRGAVPPLPRRRLRELAVTMPGLYDLLPSYRCVVDDGSLRRLTPADIAGLGGDPELAAARTEAPAGDATIRLRPFVGVDQPTMQAMTITDSVVDPLFHLAEDGAGPVDFAGDSTVFRKSATHGAATPSYVPQTHTALAKTDESVAFVRAVLTEGTPTPPLPGRVAIGVDVPDVVEVGQAVEIRIPTVAAPSAVTCDVTDVSTNTVLVPPRVERRDGMVVSLFRPERPGIYRVSVKGGGYSAVEQLVLAVPPTRDR